MGCASAKPQQIATPVAPKTLDAVSTLPVSGKSETNGISSQSTSTQQRRQSQETEGSVRNGSSWVKDELGFKAHLAKVSMFSQLERKYELGHLLGEGITGQVRLCTSKIDGHTYALKSLNVSKMDDSQVAELRAEIEMLKQLDHPKVVDLMEIFESDNNICLIIEYCAGGDLSDRRFKTENDLASVVYQILLAISHCHHFGIIHRDIKLENIMFASKNLDDIRLIDFGLSKMFYQKGNETTTLDRLNDKSRALETVCGTVCYMAPEVLNRSYSTKADIWAVGVIAYTLMTGGPPFVGADDTETLRLVKKADIKYDEHIWKRLSPDALEFVKALLTVDPEARPSGPDALKLPWMQKFKDKKAVEQPIDRELAKRAYDSILRFSTYPVLKKAAWMIIAFHASIKEKRKLQDIFMYLDTENVGELQVEHLMQMMVEFGETQMSRDRFALIVDDIDQDRTGAIHHMEFLSATMETVVKVSAKLIDQAFDHLDAGATGVISPQNICDLLGYRYSMEDAQEILAQGFYSLEMEPQPTVTRTLFFQMMEKVGLPSYFSSGSPGSKRNNPSWSARSREFNGPSWSARSREFAQMNATQRSTDAISESSEETEGKHMEGRLEEGGLNIEAMIELPVPLEVAELTSPLDAITE